MDDIDPNLSSPVEVDVILPCLDEAEALPWVLSRMPVGYRALVVDNGSTDGSARVAEENGAHVVVATIRGFGAACAAGLAVARAPIVAFMDADASLDPRQLPRVVRPVVDGSADLVLGRRRSCAGGQSWHLGFANRELCRLVRRRTGTHLHDLGPMRAARRDALVALGLTDPRSGYPLEMVVAAADHGWRVSEVDVDYRTRTGRSKVTGTPLGLARAVHDMSRVLAR